MKEIVFAHKPTKKTTKDVIETPKIENYKTKVPMVRIRKLIKLKQQLDDEARDVMETYGVNMSYIRGLLKTSMEQPKGRKK